MIKVFSPTDKIFISNVDVVFQLLKAKAHKENIYKRDLWIMGGYKVYFGCNGSDVNRIIKAKPSIAVIDFAEFGNMQIIN